MKPLVAVVSFASIFLLAAACGDGGQPAATPTAALTPSPTAEATAAPSPTATPGAPATPDADTRAGQFFGAEQRFAAGAHPSSVAVGDVNGDGVPDLVTANTLDSTVSVLLGNGDGTFQPQQSFAAGANPFSVAVGDLSGDGVPDLVTASAQSGDAVSVLVGIGNGTFFRPRQRLPVGGTPFSVAVGDVNGDGVPDLVTTNDATGFPDDVSVLLGGGDGTFRPQQRFPVGDSPISVTVADLDSDGALDLVTANGTLPGDVSVLLGNGDGTFQPHQEFDAGSLPRSVAVGDVNGDGAPDIVTLGVLVTGDSVSRFVSVLLGSGDGTFQPPQERFPVRESPASVAVTDLDGDGAPDLVLTNSDGISVFLHR